MHWKKLKGISSEKGDLEQNVPPRHFLMA